MSLFSSCSECCQKTKGLIERKVGSCIHVLQKCESCGHERYWISQPYSHAMPMGNLLISSSILFSGSLPSKVLLFFQFMNLACISRRSFFRHQRVYLFPTLDSFWAGEQEKLLRVLRQDEEPLVIAGDARSDSPGHSAEFGSYTLMEQRLSKVVDFQVVQVFH